MRIGKIGVAVIGLVPFNVYGECTPTPDCASIGYTETSCETDYLACPFDSTKLKCIPCDSSYRYDCSGDNITGGTGSACGGKYASCECSSTDYVFNNGKDNLEQIVTKLNKGEIFDETVTITFVEGKNMRYIAKTISENTNNTEEDVYEVLNDSDYINSLVEKYWFITEEITDENIYYSLEGYLLPDTYTFVNKDITVEEIFNHILGYTDKYLSAHRDSIEQTGLTIHQLLTLASITELEGSNFEDRQEIIGVFYNRLNEEMSLGSDVTTYYAVKKEMADGDLTQDEINSDNMYNTRNSK